MGTEGFNVEIGSLESLITGGVTFTTPADDQGSPQLQQKAYYRLYNNRSEVREKMFEQHLDFVMLFSESIRGFKSGCSD